MIFGEKEEGQLSPSNTPIQILRILDKSNCRKCGEKTCLAFALAVFKGQKKIEACPKLDSRTIEEYSKKLQKQKTIMPDGVEYLTRLGKEIVNVDLTEAAKRIGGRVSGDKLTLKVLGKDFSVDTNGNLFSEIHINPWVATPFLFYILYGKGLPVLNHWVSFRELKDGRDHYPIFKKRCEDVLKEVADTYPGLFDDIIHIFSGKPVARQFESDISVVLHPLPKVPMMICYWLPVDGLDSSLNVFFDLTADKNLDT
ncbi:MAG: DUF3786 domain-containing protein, partial [Deltaproteobacteria bacterium]|nr:DUF3786 domain-containing protein [Deltaproteobacteria bacterium]